MANIESFLDKITQALIQCAYMPASVSEVQAANEEMDIQLQEMEGRLQDVLDK